MFKLIIRQPLSAISTTTPRFCATYAKVFFFSFSATHPQKPPLKSAAAENGTPEKNGHPRRKISLNTVCRVSICIVGGGALGGQNNRFYGDLHLQFLTQISANHYPPASPPGPTIIRRTDRFSGKNPYKQDVQNRKIRVRSSKLSAAYHFQ